MPRDRTRLAMGLAAVALTVGCEDDAGHAARLSPSVVWVGDQDGRYRIEGLNPVAYLRGGAGEVRLVDDYAATIGDLASTVVAVDGAGVDVTLAAPLPVGEFPLVVVAGARTWRTEAAVAVVADPIDGTCAPPPADCTVFTCPTTTGCYYLCAARNWTAARNQCAANGLGCLVTIDDQAENDCVAAATDPVFPALVWTGWRQAIGASEPAGGWDWECAAGSSYRAPNWGGFEPNDEDGEDCGAMGAGGTWIDGSCNSSLRFVCER